MMMMMMMTSSPISEVKVWTPGMETLSRGRTDSRFGLQTGCGFLQEVMFSRVFLSSFLLKDPDHCPGLGGILVVTMVTSFLVLYNSSSRDGPPSRSSAPRWDPPKRRPALVGYSSVPDRKVNLRRMTF
ncbi:hypothetical protein FQA47_012294 [Oryzias melastigma]|uniref:Uncharacterized protein n=1 Tax=Oryzias melastigma TaxID=30732 RepID=A0A834CDZ6_ORYME|nr:hypothetical protein FQA47_012294 [Oryzias melastigma]